MPFLFLLFGAFCCFCLVFFVWLYVAVIADEQFLTSWLQAIIELGSDMGLYVYIRTG